MRRRVFLSGIGAGLAGPWAAAASPPAEARKAGTNPVLRLGPGPYLFLDDYLIAERQGLRRVVRPPRKVERPVLDSARFGTTQPYLSVLRDPDAGHFRMWYNHGPAIWHAVSDDGLAWREPRVAWDIPRGYCCSVLDDRGRERDPNRRFKAATWQSTHELDDGPQDNGGLWVGFSPDGFRWTGHAGNPVLRTWPEGYGKQSRYGVGDTCDAFYDPLRRQYACAIKVNGLKGEYPPGPKSGSFSRRLVGITTSPDFIHWERPERILVPDSRDEGLLEFYGMGALHTRGELTIGLARILRDDLPCDPGGPADGIGYTVLVTSRDGKQWERSWEPFVDRSPTTAWDHAMAWASAVLPVGDELFIYYGGYARGHKIAAGTERQIGVVRMARDRYVAREAGADRATLRTHSLILPRGRRQLTVNAEVRGELRVRVLDAEGRPHKGWGWDDCRPLHGDSLEHPVRWKRAPASLPVGPIHLEFALQDTSIYGFDLPEVRT